MYAINMIFGTLPRYTAWVWNPGCAFFRKVHLLILQAMDYQNIQIKYTITNHYAYA